MAYGLTQSADLEASSSQNFSRADTASLSITGAITLEGWIKIESLGQGFFCTKQDSGSNRSWQFQYLNVGGGVYRMRGYVSGNAGGDFTSDVEGTVDMTAYVGVWCHVAFTWDVSGAPKIYLNGVDISTAQTNVATSIYDGGATIRLGVIQNPGIAYFDGRMSLWRIWSTARSQAQIAANMCNVLGSTANLAAEWTLDNTLNDNSGNSNTLTNVNSTTFGADVPAICAVVGPANLKSLNTNLKANIKTIDGNPIANVKSLDTIV